MNVPVYLVVISFLVSMFFVKKNVKFAILLMFAMLFRIVYIPLLPFGGDSMKLALFCCLLSEFKNIRYQTLNSGDKSIVSIYYIALSMAIFTIIISPHLRSIHEIATFVIDSLFFGSFVFFYSYSLVKTKVDLKPAINTSFYSSVVLTVFGVINYISKKTIWIEWMLGTRKIAGDDALFWSTRFMDSDRFRICSMFSFPFDYGYICLMVLLLHIYGYYCLKLESRNQFYLTAICCLFGILFCGARTILFCLFIGVVAYILIANPIKYMLKYAVLSICILLFSYGTIPFVQSQVDSVLSMFEHDSDVSGSSLDGRMLQFAAVFSHIHDKPLIGNGYDYFNIDMGWADDKGMSKGDADLMGLESVAMNYLLERGILGFLLYLLYYFRILKFSIRYRERDRQTSAIFIAVLISYFSYANMTGELASVIPTLIILGALASILKKSNINQNENKIQHLNTCV